MVKYYPNHGNLLLEILYDGYGWIKLHWWISHWNFGQAFWIHELSSHICFPKFPISLCHWKLYIYLEVKAWRRVGHRHYYYDGCLRWPYGLKSHLVNGHA
jgi:hypothetical protein